MTDGQSEACAANAPDILEATAYADRHPLGGIGVVWNIAYFAYLAGLKAERKRDKTNKIPTHHFNGDEPIEY